MGFLDKAKKLAEQAQTKLDEVQGQMNTNPARPGTSSGPVTEYDKHGRPVASMGSTPPATTPGASEAVTSAPREAGPTGSPATPPVEAAPSAPPPAPTPGASGAVMSAQREAEPVEEDRNHPSYEPPPLTSGDPLAG
jgi:hypothetical protein